MQVKTIKKTIVQKMEWWLKTIEDKELRNDVRQSLLLTGGSICNMLQQMDVNDYDLYFMDMDVLVRLCKYYVSDIPSIEIMDGRKKDEYMKVVEERHISNVNYVLGANTINLNETNIKELLADESLPDDVRKELETERDFAHKSVAIRTLQPTQVKMYMSDPSGYNPDKGKKKEKKPKKYTVSFISPNAISLHGDIQIVTRFTGSPETIHKTFDFVHATNYFTYKDGLVFNPEALLSIQSKQLFYQGSLYPLSSIIRVKKFINRGWKISAGEQLKMIYQCSKLNLDEPDTLEEQLIGVDVAFFGHLMDILRGEKESYTTEMLMNAIDKVFNSYEYDMEPDKDEEEPEDE